MKKSKEILIWGSTLLCIYFVAWLIFTLDIFSKGKDIENNLKMALYLKSDFRKNGMKSERLKTMIPIRQFTISLDTVFI